MGVVKDMVELVVNGERVRAPVGGAEFLSEFLRERLGLTGTKVGCGIGVCGLCTVWMDGRPISSCLVPTAVAAGRSVWTVEGFARLAEDGIPSEGLPPDAPPPALVRILLRAFLACEGLQCGICTPGQLLMACALLLEDPNPVEAEIRRYLAGNLCRCTGYGGILRAIRKAAEEWAPHASP